MSAYRMLSFSNAILLVIAAILLIRTVRSYHNVEKQKKSSWTWLIILYGPITGLIYIWKIDPTFEKTNEMNITNNGSQNRKNERD